VDILIFVPLLTFIFLSVGLGAIIGALAQRKHRSRPLWWIAGALGFPIALVSILCFRDLEQIPNERKSASTKKEYIVFIVIILLWTAMFFGRIRSVGGITPTTGSLWAQTLQI